MRHPKEARDNLQRLPRPARPPKGPGLPRPMPRQAWRTNAASMLESRVENLSLSAAYFEA
ncbi:hypothetical protein GCM10017668_50890 [Streptomyces tuirus]|uniref:Uncharacterized protein n=1 Tax=Streptomyces tuirus TaxID=68278 RepID=A0A7G1NP00_9ACTN|nr:hypothetical protein GCM10017668_50890 [Streptomyces tuirus]